VFRKTIIFAVTLCIIGILSQLIFGFHNAQYQLIYLFLGLVIYLLLQKINIYSLLKLAHFLSLFGFCLLILLLLIGEETRGSKRWFFIFGFGIQPSIFFIPFFLLSLIQLLLEKPIRKFLQLLIYLLLLLLPTFLIFKQPDLGTSLVFFSTIFVVIIYSCFRIKYLFWLSLLTLPLIYILPHFLKPYQLQRIASFLNPHLDPSGINYNSLQSIIAIGSGGFFGRGLNSINQSKLAFLPENHTDFVFASFTQSFGFVGVMILLTCYYFFLKSILDDIVFDAEKKYFEYYSLGVFVFIFIQFVFNVGMNLRLLPVVGVPLPLLSYGGSTILTLFILLGLREKLREI